MEVIFRQQLRNKLRAMDSLFVPITCRACKRHSAMCFSRAELRQKLEHREVIEFRCVYDDHGWATGFRERMQLTRWLNESEATARSLFDRAEGESAHANPA
jgi:hypothetical protein